MLLLAAFAQPMYEENANANDAIYLVEKTAFLTAAVYDMNGNPIVGAKAFIKGTKKETTTNKKGVFTLEVGLTDIVIIKHAGFEKGVIYMEKIVAKNGKSDSYKLKLKLKPEGNVKSEDNSVSDEIKELENMLKELALKKEELTKMKQKIMQAEKEGSVDQEILDKKKASLKEDYKAVEAKRKKVEHKLQSLKSQ